MRLPDGTVAGAALATVRRYDLRTHFPRIRGDAHQRVSEAAIRTARRPRRRVGRDQ